MVEHNFGAGERWKDVNSFHSHDYIVPDLDHWIKTGQLKFLLRSLNLFFLVLNLRFRGKGPRTPEFGREVSR